jgi:hypothetical protein
MVPKFKASSLCIFSENFSGNLFFFFGKMQKRLLNIVNILRTGTALKKVEIHKCGKLIWMRVEKI